MKTYTIPKKMSGTGTIYDIASCIVDRDIVFPSGCRYAIVDAAYYGGKGYTVHRTESGVIAAVERLGNYAYQIIDSTGRRYEVEYDQLVTVGE